MLIDTTLDAEVSRFEMFLTGHSRSRRCLGVSFSFLEDDEPLGRNAQLFVAQGGHGVKTAGAERGDVAGGAGDGCQGSHGGSQGQGIVRSEAKELVLHDASESLKMQ